LIAIKYVSVGYAAIIIETLLQWYRADYPYLCTIRCRGNVLHTRVHVSTPKEPTRGMVCIKKCSGAILTVLGLVSQQ
jgi:hypothetical protein